MAMARAWQRTISGCSSFDERLVVSDGSIEVLDTLGPRFRTASFLLTPARCDKIIAALQEAKRQMKKATP